MTPPTGQDPLRKVDHLIRWVMVCLIITAALDLTPHFREFWNTPQRVINQTVKTSLNTARRILTIMQSLDLLGIDGRLEDINHYLGLVGITMHMWGGQPENPSHQSLYPTELALLRLKNKIARQEPLHLPDQQIAQLASEMELLVIREKQGMHRADEPGGVKSILNDTDFQQRLHDLETFQQEWLSGDISPQQWVQEGFSGFWWRMDNGQFTVVTALPRQDLCLDCHENDRSNQVYFTFEKGIASEISKLQQQVIEKILVTLLYFLLIGLAVFLLRHRIINLIQALHQREKTLEMQKRELVVNLTEAKKTELRLAEAKDNAEEAIRIKDKFIAIISHDLRSPLVTLVATLEWLAEEVTLPGHRNVIRELSRRTEQMINMIKQLLDMSKLQTGVIRPQPALFNLAANVDALLASYKTLADKKEIELVNECPVQQQLYADMHLLNRVLENLIANAIKFCRPGDRVVCRMDGTVEPPLLVVADTGTGIAAEVLPHIFKKDVMTTQLGTSGEVGNGLGLPLCQELLKAMGGHLSVDSVLNEYSVFSIHLPAPVYQTQSQAVVDHGDLIY